MSDIQFKTGVISPVECFKEGWELIKSDYWLLMAIVIVGALIGGFTLYILLGAMCCGIFYCYLRKIDGKPIAFDDLWKGFQWWLPGLGVTALIVIPMIIVYSIIYAPIVLALVMGSNLTSDGFMGLFIGAGIIDLLLVVIMVCFHTLLMFSFPLIADRNLGAVEAVKTSIRAVWKNLGGVVGLILCGMGLSILGELALCIGIYFVIPIVVAGNTVAYRKVFPAIPGHAFNPAAQSAYPGV
jgi:hypothetical protein